MKLFGMQRIRADFNDWLFRPVQAESQRRWDSSGTWDGTPDGEARLRTRDGVSNHGSFWQPAKPPSNSK